MNKQRTKEKETGSIVELVDNLINSAIGKNASDIHIDPTVDDMIVRFRIDGVLTPFDVISADVHEFVIARIKMLASLRTDIHFVPQDGRFIFGEGMRMVDVRVSIMPTHYGENVVMRIVPQDNLERGFASLGFSEKDIEKIDKAIKHPQGMVLVTAPSGNGTTSTLYTMLQSLAKCKSSIVTLEDPVEYALAGIRQIQIKEKHGITFANGLRSIVRQDPDIIMVGEIRDEETAQIAVNISLTGHLLISALHSNSALGAIPRLIDMGVDPYLVASTLSLVIAQRLVRKLHNECKGVGCANCDKTGFKGRTVISEVLTIDDEMRKYIMSRVGLTELSRYARSTGMTPMYEDGMEKVEQGITTKEEVLRVLHE